MNFNPYKKVIDYIKKKESVSSLNYNELGFTNHCDALHFFQSLQGFGNLFVVKQLKKKYWNLTNKGHDILLSCNTNKGDDTSMCNLIANDTLLHNLKCIKESRENVIEEDLLKEYETCNLIEKSDTVYVEITKGDEFNENLELGEDLTEDILKSDLWKKVLLHSYDFNKMGCIKKFGTFHTVYDFITSVRHALFELGFSEVLPPVIIEKGLQYRYDMDILQELDDCSFNVTLGKYYTEKENGDETDFKLKDKQYNLRSSLFHHLFSFLSSLKFIPCKLFSIGKAFQNKEFSNFDIPEFHALEIIICDSDLDLSNVVGVCSALLTRLNIPYIDFKQAYFPYTSPTVGIYLYNEVLDAWVSVGSGGIAHPQLMKYFHCNENTTVLRLGFSLERILCNKKEVDDINQLIGSQEKQEC